VLIVMFGPGTWRARPGQALTFGRDGDAAIRLPSADHGVSRSAGSFRFHDGAWWVHNDSSASMLYLSGDRGFRADLPPGLRMPLQQWHAKVRLQGVLGSYTLRVRLPALDELPDPGAGPAQAAGAGAGPAGAAQAAGARAVQAGGAGPVRPAGRRGGPPVTTTRYRAPLSATDRLVLAARFEEYLDWRHAGAPAPRSAKDAAARIGWPPHTVAKRCENIRDRYSRLGVPGLRGPRALEDLAGLLICTGELTAGDLRRLPPVSGRSSASRATTSPAG
jgi:predicted component of type VI protein secretion system